MSTNPFEEEEQKSANPFEEPHDPNRKTSLKPLASFQGLIGQCFEPYLNIYIESIDK